MKKAFLILGVVAVSAAAGGFTAWKVTAPREGSVQYIEREVERTPALGTHFTSYQAEQYPDLTYAAENAVKAVVNIEAVQQVEMPRRRGYDPFLEFFGIPQGYDEGPQFREQRAGGSGKSRPPTCRPCRSVRRTHCAWASGCWRSVRLSTCNRPSRPAS